MSSTHRFIPTRLVCGLLLGLCVFWGACDTVPGQTGERQSPRVSALQIIVDSVQVVEADSLVEIDMITSVRAADPDGAVERVVFTLEPASNVQQTVAAELQSTDGSVYAGRVGVSVPLVSEVYSVRIFAEDDDGLASNWTTSQFRLVTESELTDSTSGFRFRKVSGSDVWGVGTRDDSVVLSFQHP